MLGFNRPSSFNLNLAKIMTREEAINKGYLKNQKIILKPVPRAGRMINDPAHKGYFMYEGAVVTFVLPKDSRNALINPFESQEEQKFFEDELSQDLNIHKKTDNFWHTFKVKFMKTPTTIKEGMSFNLSDPLDMLRVKVLRVQKQVAPSWEQRFQRPSYSFALIGEDFEETEQNKELERTQKMFTFYGTIQNHPSKMKDFLDVFFMDNKQLKNVPSDASEKFLNAELMKIMKDQPDQFIRVMDDDNYEMKAFIAKAIRVGAIEKRGINSYVIPGETIKWTLPEIVRHLEQLKENSDDVYLKIEAQINMDSKPKGRSKKQTASK